MHELSLIHALFDEADRALGIHAAHQVQQITLRVGRHAAVEPDLLLTAFQVARELRGYGAATLVLEADESDALILQRLDLDLGP
jgi:Zn finger protein HypA/HybF involved in hydrogenase expression